jgi:hypothetical protein
MSSARVIRHMGMDAKNLATLYDLPTLDWAPISARLDQGLTQAPGTGGPNRHLLAGDAQRGATAWTF